MMSDQCLVGIDVIPLLLLFLRAQPTSEAYKVETQTEEQLQQEVSEANESKKYAESWRRETAGYLDAISIKTKQTLPMGSMRTRKLVFKLEA
jgi:hypothetical protein